MKTLIEKLQDNLSKYPHANVSDVYQVTYDRHQRSIWKLQDRLSERIQEMLTGNVPVFFLTLTYSDDYLPSKENELNTDYQVQDFMSKHDVVSYVANADYGSKNGRFHWHVVAAARSKFNREFWIYGASKFKVVKLDSIPKALAKYLVKLKRHAVKIDEPHVIVYPRFFRSK